LELFENVTAVRFLRHSVFYITYKLQLYIQSYVRPMSYITIFLNKQKLDYVLLDAYIWLKSDSKTNAVV